MEMGFGLSKQTWRMGPREQDPAHTHTHTLTPREPRCAVTLIHRKRDVLIGQPRSVMASKTPLMLRERVVKSTEVCFIYSLIYSIHSEGEHQWLWQAPSWCPLPSKSSLKLMDWYGRTPNRGRWAFFFPVRRWFNRKVYTHHVRAISCMFYVALKSTNRCSKTSPSLLCETNVLRKKERRVLVSWKTSTYTSWYQI